MVARLKTAPTGEVVPVGDLKPHVSVDSSEEEFDSLLGGYISSAVRHLDGATGVLGRCILEQVWEEGHAAFSRQMRLPFPDVSGVVVKYYDVDGLEQTIDASEYEIIETSRSAIVHFFPGFSFPSVDTNRLEPITLETTAGYGEPNNVPADLKQAILMLAAHWFLNREAASKDALSHVPLGFDVLIEPHRRVGL